MYEKWELSDQGNYALELPKFFLKIKYALKLPIFSLEIKFDGLIIFCTINLKWEWGLAYLRLYALKSGFSHFNRSFHLYICFGPFHDIRQLKSHSYTHAIELPT